MSISYQKNIMMKKSIKTSLSLFLAVLMLMGLAFTCLAASPVFEDGAYASIVTGSDFQNYDMEAYRRFDRILGKMKADGLETPHSMLMGGDFTMVLLDYPTPGIVKLREALTKNYPDFNADNLVCIQGNHDNVSSYFTKTGFYDMGEYCLYAINENDFPWQQNIRPNAEKRIKALAEDITKNCDHMISTGDLRPVIVMTHVPLHHTTRSSGADNRYASYIFEALNKAGETLDVIFLFGHNHSGTFDDYIGGSVNFMAPGDTIRIPDKNNPGKTNYTTETLNFTYLNYGYTGYSGNSVSQTSTNELTAGVIRLTNDSVHFIKYSENGFYCEQTVAKKNPVEHLQYVSADGTKHTAVNGTNIENTKLWLFENKLIQWIFHIFNTLKTLFGK